MIIPGEGRRCRLSADSWPSRPCPGTPKIAGAHRRSKRLFQQRHFNAEMLGRLTSVRMMAHGPSSKEISLRATLSRTGQLEVNSIKSKCSPKAQSRSRRLFVPRWVLPGRTQRLRRQLTRGRRRNLIEIVYPGSIASGDLGLLLFSAVLQNLLNDLPAPGESGFDMGII